MARSVRMPLDRLEKLQGSELRKEWVHCYGAPTPNISPDLLRLGVAYRLQEKRRGGISRETRRILRQASKASGLTDEAKSPPPRKLTVGTRLVRDWHGAGHTITVLDEGFEYEGRVWRSLTAIAKAITGTHRNGPRFFGLTR